ncbi:MAG: GNAT family N-acetyltransferase [Nocardioides sp.]
MNHVDVREIDPGDEAQLRAWWEVGRASTAERPIDAWPHWEVSRVTLPRRRTDLARTLLGAFDGDRVVGAAAVVQPLLDNTHLAEIDVQVLPGERRRGVGRTLLTSAEDHARGAGRRALAGSVYAPVGAESPGSQFAAASGYPVASHEETKVVDLADAVAGWAAIDDEVAAGLGGYRVEGFETRVPEAYVDDFCDLLSTFMTSIPSGDLDLRDAVWTPARLREHHERTLEAGEAWLVAVGVASDGRLCGFTELGIDRADPRHASVGGTLVLPEHRGHRLGLGMKLATHRRVLELFSTCGHVETGNAGVNAPMNAVNARLGYRVVERCLDVQKLL